MRARDSDLVKVWLDDVENYPDGWDYIGTVHGAIDFLRNYLVEHLSLDSDLGSTQEEQIARGGDGYEVLRWLDNNKEHLPYRISLHSSNPDGRFHMRCRLNEIGYEETRKYAEYTLPITRKEWLNLNLNSYHKLF